MKGSSGVRLVFAAVFAAMLAVVVPAAPPAAPTSPGVSAPDWTPQVELRVPQLRMGMVPAPKPGQDGPAPVWAPGSADAPIPPAARPTVDAASSAAPASPVTGTANPRAPPASTAFA